MSNLGRYWGQLTAGDKSLLREMFAIYLRKSGGKLIPLNKLIFIGLEEALESMRGAVAFVNDGTSRYHPLWGEQRIKRGALLAKLEDFKGTENAGK